MYAMNIFLSDEEIHTFFSEICYFLSDAFAHASCENLFLKFHTWILLENTPMQKYFLCSTRCNLGSVSIPYFHKLKYHRRNYMEGIENQSANTST